MAQKQAEILTPWFEETIDGESNRYPLLMAHFHLAKWQDITGQDSANLLPEPNLVSLLVEAEESVIASIELDNRFLILWEEYV